MPKATAGTPKAIANAAKAKGLGRLRWYCQVCEKQCRDDNGFKCHIATEAHLRQMLVVGESSSKYIDGFSKDFMDGFMALLSRRYNTKRVRANQVYQEYIQDKEHIHMNSTKWITLTEFVKHLGKEGLARVDDTEKGWFIAWVDNSPAAMARQEAIMKKERQDTDDEQRQRKLLAEQIARAQATSSSSTSTPDESVAAVEAGLVRPEGEGGEKVKLAFTFGKKAASPPEGSSTTTTAAPTATTAGGGPLKMSFNPLKRPAPTANVFKSKPLTSSSTATSVGGAGGGKMSATEALMKEDAERKRRLAERTGPAFPPGGKRLKM